MTGVTSAVTDFICPHLSFPGLETHRLPPARNQEPQRSPWPGASAGTCPVEGAAGTRVMLAEGLLTLRGEALGAHLAQPERESGPAPSSSQPPAARTQALTWGQLGRTLGAPVETQVFLEARLPSRQAAQRGWGAGGAPSPVSSQHPLVERRKEAEND